MRLKACVRCHKSKTKCSHERPCARCKRMRQKCEDRPEYKAQCTHCNEMFRKRPGSHHCNGPYWEEGKEKNRILMNERHANCTHPDQRHTCLIEVMEVRTFNGNRTNLQEPVPPDVSGTKRQTSHIDVAHSLSILSQLTSKTGDGPGGTQPQSVKREVKHEEIYQCDVTWCSETFGSHVELTEHRMAHSSRDADLESDNVPLQQPSPLQQSSIDESPTRRITEREATAQLVNKSCHQCKMKRMDLTYCTNIAPPSKKKIMRPCRKKYCDKCLRKWYNEQPLPDATANKTQWLCPACRGCCNCAACRKTRDNVDKPSLIHEAIKQLSGSTGFYKCNQSGCRRTFATLVELDAHRREHLTAASSNLPATSPPESKQPPKPKSSRNPPSEFPSSSTADIKLKNLKQTGINNQYHSTSCSPPSVGSSAPLSLSITSRPPNIIASSNRLSRSPNTVRASLGLTLNVPPIVNMNFLMGHPVSPNLSVTSPNVDASVLTSSYSTSSFSPNALPITPPISGTAPMTNGIPNILQNMAVTSTAPITPSTKPSATSSTSSIQSPSLKTTRSNTLSHAAPVSTIPAMSHTSTKSTHSMSSLPPVAPFPSIVPLGHSASPTTFSPLSNHSINTTPGIRLHPVLVTPPRNAPTQTSDDACGEKACDRKPPDSSSETPLSVILRNSSSAALEPGLFPMKQSSNKQDPTKLGEARFVYAVGSPRAARGALCGPKRCTCGRIDTRMEGRNRFLVKRPPIPGQDPGAPGMTDFVQWSREHVKQWVERLGSNKQLTDMAQLLYEHGVDGAILNYNFDQVLKVVEKFPQESKSLLSSAYYRLKQCNTLTSFRETGSVCEACHKAHTKCNRQVPCSRCLRLQKPCIPRYAEAARRRGIFDYDYTMEPLPPSPIAKTDDTTLWEGDTPTTPFGPVCQKSGIRILYLDFGRIEHENMRFHSNEYIWPLGFKSDVHFWSVVNPATKTTYTNEIIRSKCGTHPLFRVTAADATDKPVVEKKPEDAWNKILMNLRENNIDESIVEHTNAYELFGFVHPFILKHIQELPHADECFNYEEKKFTPEQLQVRIGNDEPEDLMYREDLQPTTSHDNSHDEKNKLHCQFCGLGFELSCCLVNHIRRYHNNNGTFFFSDEQTRHLNESFKNNTHPDHSEKVRLATMFNFPIEKIVVWFSNKRARQKRQRGKRLAETWQSQPQSQLLLQAQAQTRAGSQDPQLHFQFPHPSASQHLPLFGQTITHLPLQDAPPFKKPQPKNLPRSIQTKMVAFPPQDIHSPAVNHPSLTRPRKFSDSYPGAAVMENSFGSDGALEESFATGGSQSPKIVLGEKSTYRTKEAVSALENMCVNTEVGGDTKNRNKNSKDNANANISLPAGQSTSFAPTLFGQQIFMDPLQFQNCIPETNLNVPLNPYGMPSVESENSILQGDLPSGDFTFPIPPARVLSSITQHTQMSPTDPGRRSFGNQHHQFQGLTSMACAPPSVGSRFPRPSATDTDGSKSISTLGTHPPSVADTSCAEIFHRAVKRQPPSPTSSTESSPRPPTALSSDSLKSTPTPSPGPSSATYRYPPSPMSNSSSSIDTKSLRIVPPTMPPSPESSPGQSPKPPPRVSVSVSSVKVQLTSALPNASGQKRKEPGNGTSAGIQQTSSVRVPSPDKLHHNLKPEPIQAAIRGDLLTPSIDDTGARSPRLLLGDRSPSLSSVMLGGSPSLSASHSELSNSSPSTPVPYVARDACNDSSSSQTPSHSRQTSSSSFEAYSSMTSSEKESLRSDTNPGSMSSMPMNDHADALDAHFAIPDVSESLDVDGQVWFNAIDFGNEPP